SADRAVRGRDPGGADRVQRRPRPGARRLAAAGSAWRGGALRRDGGQRRHPGLRAPHPRVSTGLSRPEAGDGGGAVSPRRRQEDALAPLRRPEWVAEARRKAIHLSFLILPLELLLELLPWPRTRGQFRLLFLALTAAAIALDVLRIHERRVRTIFRRFFGEMLRRHEQMSLLRSTYLLLA